MTGKPFVIRDVTDPWKMRELEPLQNMGFGYGDLDVLPATMLRISAVTGGTVLGAYPAGDENAPAVGLAYGFPAYAQGQLWHHSHLLATKPEWRGSGMAVALKHAQRERVLAQGITRMTWTFDPLIARNARLNLGKLGARAVSYHPNWYALGESKETAFPADRLLIEWDLTKPSQERLAPQPEGEFIVQADENGLPRVKAAAGATLLAEVPTRDLPGPEKLAWRLALREALTDTLGAGYVITDLARDGERAYYVLTK